MSSEMPTALELGVECSSVQSGKGNVENMQVWGIMGIVCDCDLRFDLHPP